MSVTFEANMVCHRQLWKCGTPLAFALTASCCSEWHRHQVDSAKLKSLLESMVPKADDAVTSARELLTF